MKPGSPSPLTPRKHPVTTNFNVVRLFLAALVIFSHSPELIDGNRGREPLSMLGLSFTLGDVAVRGFFLLSGYLIVMSWRREPSLVAFLRKRVLRIYPAFIICSLVCLLLALWSGGEVNWSRAPIRAAVLAQPDATRAFAGTYHAALNGSMWTIPLEFACYLTVAAVGVWLTPVRCILAAVALAIVSRLPMPFDGIWYWIHKYSSLGLWFFLGGAFAWRTFKLSLPNLETDISYGVYLYGWPAQKVLLWIWPSLTPWLLSLAALAAACACGWASYTLIEEPCLRLKWRNYRKRAIDLQPRTPSILPNVKTPPASG